MFDIFEDYEKRGERKGYARAKPQWRNAEKMLNEKVMKTKQQDKFRNDYMAWGLVFRDIKWEERK